MPEMTAENGGNPQPILDRARNLVPDPQFEKVVPLQRSYADADDVAYIYRTTRWSDDWAVTGSSSSVIELLGQHWFGPVDDHGGVYYRIGWPQDPQGNRIHYAMMITTLGEMSLAKKVHLPQGAVNVNFLGVRNNWLGSLTHEAELEVILEQDGGRATSQKLQFRRQDKNNPSSTDGHWQRYSVDFQVPQAGNYWLRFRGVPQGNNPPQCAPFITDIFLCPRAKPKLLNVEGAEGPAPHWKVKARADQHFRPLTFLFAVGSGFGVLRNHLVTVELRDPAQSGLHFEGSDQTKFSDRTNSDGFFFLPGHQLKAGPKADKTGELVVVIDGEEIGRVSLEVLERAPISGVAESVDIYASPYLSGDMQTAASRRRFSRALRVSVFDSGHQRATSGQVTFSASSTNGQVRSYVSASENLEWNSASQTEVDVPVRDGNAQAWLIGEFSGADSAGPIAVAARVKGKSSRSVIFHESVWSQNASFLILRVGGDRQHVTPGAPVTGLRAKLVMESTSRGISNEWIRWEIMDATVLRFKPLEPGAIFYQESAHTIWTRTDPDGIARAPALERIGSDKGTGHVRASTPLAAETSFTLFLDPAIQYTIGVGENDALPLHTVQHRTITVRDSITNQPVSGVRVDAEVLGEDGNPAQIHPLRQHQITNGAGQVSFGFTAGHSGATTVLLSAEKAHVRRLLLTATSHVVRETLTVLTQQPLMVSRDHETKSANLITVVLDPADDDVDSIAYAITPADDDGLLLKDESGNWNSNGKLPMVDGRTTITALRVGVSETSQYQIQFSVPGQEHAIHPVTFQVRVGEGAAALEVYPQGTSSDHPYEIDSGTSIDNDPNVRVIAYKDTKKTILAPNARLHFFIVVTEPSGASPDAVAFKDGSLSATGITDQNGQCFVPALKVKNGFVGAFNIAVSNEGAGTTLANLYFGVKQAAAATLLEFEDARTKLKPSHPYAVGVIGSVKVYSDAGKQHPVRSGQVAFSLPGETKGATFQEEGGQFPSGGKAIVRKVVSLDSSGEAQIPAIRTGHAGSLTLNATVVGTSVDQTLAITVA